jgi:hypothetical protein
MPGELKEGKGFFNIVPFLQSGRFFPPDFLHGPVFIGSDRSSGLIGLNHQGALLIRSIDIQMERLVGGEDRRMGMTIRVIAPYGKKGYFRRDPL